MDRDSIAASENARKVQSLDHTPHSNHNSIPTSPPLPHRHRMDTPFVSSLFRALFRHRPCPSRPHSFIRNGVRRIAPGSTSQHPSVSQRRTIFVGRDDAKQAKEKGEWHQKSPWLHIDMTEEFKRYPLVTAEQLSTRTERPRRVKMLVRDYIDGSSFPPSHLPPYQS